MGNHCQSIGVLIFNLLYQIGPGIGSIWAEDENVILRVYGQHLQKNIWNLKLANVQCAKLRLALDLSSAGSTSSRESSRSSISEAADAQLSYARKSHMFQSIFILKKFHFKLGNEIVCKWIRLKISQTVGSNIQQIAGGSRPPEKKRSQEQCQSHQGNVWMATGAKVSKMSQACSHVSHGDSSMCSELYF